MNPNVVKAAGIIIKDKKLLIVRSTKLDQWISLGGKQEEGESLEETLRREIKEEINVDVVGEPELMLVSPIMEAAGQPDLTVQIHTYFVEVEGDITPSAEVSEIHWLTKKQYLEDTFKLGGILQHIVIPELIEKGLM